MSLNGRGDELFHTPPLPLPGYGQRGEEGGDHHHDDGKEPRNDIVPALQLPVEPDPNLSIHGPERFPQEVLHVFLGIDGHDGRCIAEGNGGSVGIAPIHDGLHGDASPGTDSN